MRNLFFIFILFFSFSIRAQMFWTETFGSAACSGGALASAYVGPNGAWSVTNTGVNNTSANDWFVSAKERGMGVGICGAGCGGTNNKTLHIGSTGAFNDNGASYNETGIGNATDKRAESPLINCTGKTGITFSFSYIENGEGTFDNATLWYFNGTVWAQLSDPAKTLCCASAACTGFNQGLWINYSIALPASANNNAGIKIGFRWVNNGNGIGTDPSVAIDDVTLSVPVLPIELSAFTVEKVGETVLLKWTTMTERNFEGFSVERSEDGISYYEVSFIKGAGNSNSKKNYTFNDNRLSNGIYYYRIKEIDIDKSYKYSPVKTIQFLNTAESVPYYNTENSEIIIPVTNLNIENLFTIDLISADGKKIKSLSNTNAEIVNNTIHIPISALPLGLYVLRLYDNESSRSFRVVISH